ncbi:hypothetical protein DERP_012393 [Dermatophagoides pteronyssinus]|uniref:Uncharacterized protein n=1 Tax=Dermatophagoides pteronyssinus TaxID=6956 RepID=A0ABQ8IUM9_DERPT|nr:hypothetical protein DERP_012393 [Dermatophagoides pteronyssinus]
MSELGECIDARIVNRLFASSAKFRKQRTINKAAWLSSPVVGSSTNKNVGAFNDINSCATAIRFCSPPLQRSNLRSKTFGSSNKRSMILISESAEIPDRYWPFKQLRSVLFPAPLGPRNAIFNTFNTFTSIFKWIII